MKIVIWYAKLNTFLTNCIPSSSLGPFTVQRVRGVCPPREVLGRSSGPRLWPRPPRLTEVRMEGTAPCLSRRCSVVVRAFDHCARLPRSVQSHPTREPDHSRRAIAGAQRWRCRRPRATRSAGVSKHHSSHSNASRLLSAAVLPDDRTAMALFSAARSTSPPPIPEVDRRTGREGVTQLGVSRHGRPFVVCASVAGRLPLPASAPPSALVSAARRSAGALARAFGARHARSRVRGGGGGGDGARRGGRLFVFLAAPWARCWRGLCLGPSSLFFAVGANPRRPGSVRSVFGWLDGGCAAKWRYKDTRGVLFLLTEGG